MNINTSLKLLLITVASLMVVSFSASKVSAAVVGADMGTESTMLVGDSTGSIAFSGYSSPGSIIYFMENGQVIGNTIADDHGYFEKTLSGLTAIIHTIGLYSTDIDSYNTLITNYSISVGVKTTTFFSGIILPPTFFISSNTVKKPAPLNATGRSLANSTIKVFIDSARENLVLSTETNAFGSWSLNINPKLHLGLKTATALVLNGTGGQSGLSEGHQYTVLRSADLNVDNYVNLTDFSILMFSYGKMPFPNAASDISDDGVVDLTDFSIMMANFSK